MGIPKIIHYCWLSGEPFPDDIKKCIESWKVIMPDYEIKLWNTYNFDCNSLKYTQQAMEKKKYAFVSDYIRLYALYTEGGIYLDSDIEVFKRFDELLNNQAFTGFESGGRIGAWILASEKENPLFKELLDYYENLEFYDSEGRMNMTPNTVPVTKTLVEHGLKPVNDIQKLDYITVYPEEYFCPKNPWNGQIHITKNTYAMHYFNGAWNDLANKDLPFIGNINVFVKKFINWLEERNNKSKEIVIYGLGVVGRNVLEQLKIQIPDLDIIAIIVTKRDNGWLSIDGIPIIEVAEMEKYTRIQEDIVVLISTIPKYHYEIKSTLEKKNYRNYYLLGKEFV